MLSLNHPFSALQITIFLVLVSGYNGPLYGQKVKKNFASRSVGPRDIDASSLSVQEKDKLIYKQNKELRANEILNELRLRLVVSMEQRGQGRNGQDGLDISLLLINRKKKKGQWAGANTLMVQLHQDNDEPKEYKADKRPIGEYPDMRLFTNHKFSITKGDRFYMFSDGYVDQFGGPNDKKLMRKRFKKMVLDTKHLSILEQHQHFKDAVDTWWNFKPVKTQQVDDITVFGIEQ